MRLPPPRTRLLSQVQEAKVAKDLGGRVTPASGAMRDPTLKGDVSSSSFLVECKTTEGKGYTLTRAVLEKIWREAVRNNKTPLMQVEIGGAAYAVLRWEDFMEIAKDAKYV